MFVERMERTVSMFPKVLRHDVRAVRVRDCPQGTISGFRPFDPAGRSRGARARQPMRRAVAWLCVCAASMLVLSGSVRSAYADVLFSSHSIGNPCSIIPRGVVTQGFTSGSHTGGYRLTSIEILATSFRGPITAQSVVLRKDNPSTGDLAVTFPPWAVSRNPNYLHSPTYLTLKAPADTHLEADTKYYLVASGLHIPLYDSSSGQYRTFRGTYLFCYGRKRAGMVGWSLDRSVQTKYRNDVDFVDDIPELESLRRDRSKSHDSSLHFEPPMNHPDSCRWTPIVSEMPLCQANYVTDTRVLQTSQCVKLNDQSPFEYGLAAVRCRCWRGDRQPIPCQCLPMGVRRDRLRRPWVMSLQRWSISVLRSRRPTPMGMC